VSWGARKRILLCLAMALSACGVKGPPRPPEPRPAAPGPAVPAPPKPADPTR